MTGPVALLDLAADFLSRVRRRVRRRHGIKAARPRAALET